MSSKTNKEHTYKIEYASNLPEKKNKKFKKILFEVLEKLPDNVYKKLSKECIVFCSYDKFGSYIYSTRKKFVCLNVFQMDVLNMQIWMVKQIIAHEFAHAYSESSDEKVVNSLMKKWGFKYLRNVNKVIKNLKVYWDVRLIKKKI